MKLNRADIEFKINGTPIKFSVIHNLSNRFGMSFNDAFENWIVRTKKYTAKSLCKYIMSKDQSFVAMTEKQFQRLPK